jgi:hypothetical protein
MAARQRRGHNEQVLPPPPPAPMVQELMAQHNEILRQLCASPTLSSMVEASHSDLRLWRSTRSSTVRSRPCSPRQRIRWTLTCGYSSWSPSFPSSRETALMTPRLTSPRSSFTDLLGLGGTISVPCYLLFTKFLERNSRLPSEDTTSQL